MTDVLKMHLDVGQERKITDQDFLILGVVAKNTLPKRGRGAHSKG